MAEHVTLVEPYEAEAQQRQADVMGMYVFLGAEAMMFGGLICLLLAYRTVHPQATAEAARHLKLWIATANTAILLTSSLFVALAVQAAKAGGRRAVAGWLVLAMALGLGFLGLKSWEYWADWREGLMPLYGASPIRSRPAALFIDLYFVATGLHAIHMIGGVGLLGWLTQQVYSRRKRLPGQAIVVEIGGLYWHLVDIVWIFLFPLFYLARG
jgi:cytochrome c oxidase subunit 3